MTNSDNDQKQQEQDLNDLKEKLKNWEFSGSLTTDTPSYSYADDTITLSSITGYEYSNAIFGGSTAVTGSISAAGGPYTISSGTGFTNPWTTTTNTGKLKLEGDGADIEINGVSLMDLLQERLNVLIPNPEIEAEWEELKRLGDQYRELEADIKEKMEMWNKLKSSPKVDREEW